MPKNRVKLLLNMLIVAGHAIPRGGTLTLDPVGSGDALLAYAALSLFATESSVIASVLGSLAAAVECEHEGNIPVRPKDVIEKLDRFERFVKYE